jgi:hypothetical protein
MADIALAADPRTRQIGTIAKNAMGVGFLANRSRRLSRE